MTQLYPTWLLHVQQSGLPVLGGMIWAITAVAELFFPLRHRWRWF